MAYCSQSLQPTPGPHVCRCGQTVRPNRNGKVPAHTPDVSDLNWLGGISPASVEAVVLAARDVLRVGGSA